MPRKNRWDTDEDDELDEQSVIPDEESDNEDELLDDDIREAYDESQRLDYGRGDLKRRLQEHTARTPKLSGGDVDAAWDDSDGEETVGGENPTPDQSLVDDEGDAVGITYNANEPLRTTNKLEKRDSDPWELNPASSEDWNERLNREFGAPGKPAALRDASAPSKPKASNQAPRPRAAASRSAGATHHAAPKRSPRHGRKKKASPGTRSVAGRAQNAKSSSRRGTGR